jgi:hypothetical protein
MRECVETCPDLPRRVENLMRRSHSILELANRVASSSEETAALFDSRYRTHSEWGENPRADIE